MKTSPPVFERAGDIFIADLGDRGCDLRLCRVGQFDNGPAGGRGHVTRAGTARISARPGSLSQVLPINGASRFCRYLAVCGRPMQQLEKIVWHSSGATFDTMEMQPSPPLAMKGKRRCLVSGQQAKPRGSRGRKRHSRVISPLPSFKPMKWPEPASCNKRVVRQLAHGPGWNVVQYDRQRGRDRNRPEVRIPACIGLL